MPVLEIIRRCGGGTQLARALGVNRQSIYSWTRIPAERVQQIADLSGLQLHEIRPDIFRAPREEIVNDSAAQGDAA